MPVSVCVVPLCPEFASPGFARCVEHAKQHNSEQNKYYAERTTGKVTGLYKGKKWQGTRRAILRRDRYTCQACKRFGNEVDHVVPLADGGKPYAPSNLQTLCKPCHSRKTALEVGYRRAKS